MVRRRRAHVTGVLALVCLIALGGPSVAIAAQGVGAGATLSADLDGKPIALAQVGRYYCDDFAFPAIHCFSTAADLETSAAVTLSATSVTYVTLYDYPFFAGSYMYISQDYTALVTIGWNDRASSFIVKNGEAGHFYTNWFYGGTGYYFCCNQQVAALGSYDNTFSSVHLN
jgi:hypothetical protein